MTLPPFSPNATDQENPMTDSDLNIQVARALGWRLSEEIRNEMHHGVRDLQCARDGYWWKQEWDSRWAWTGYNLPGVDCYPWSPLTHWDQAVWTLTELRLALVPSEDGWYAVRPEDIEHGCVRGTDFPTLTVIGRENEEWEPQEEPLRALCLAAVRVGERKK